MRTVSGGETTVITGRVSAQYLKVEVKNAAGSWIDYSDYLNLDWQDRCEIRIDVNQRVAECTLDLARETEAGELSPLTNTEIAAGRAIRISGSRVAVGAGASFKQLFLGTIDAVAWENDPMQLVARDDAGVLVDLWIREETDYGTVGAGRAIESVMQDILNDWADGLPLYVPVSPSRPVSAYRQLKMSVQDALQALADLIGWVVEYRWDNGTGAFRLTFYEPDRTPSSTDWTFGPGDYYAVTRMSENSMDVRNMITVRYTDAATGERGVYEVSDPTSIARYRLQWAEFEEADDSPIDSAAKAQALGDAALADLAWPVVDQEIEVDLFWPVQLGDFYEFLANGRHYGANQEFGVTGYTHVFEEGKALTRIRTRGTPVGHTEGWLRREAKPRSEDEKKRASEILNFREISRTTTHVTYGWTLGSDLTESWVHNYTEKQPFSVDKWPGPSRDPDVILDDREVEYTVEVPEQGFFRYLQVEGHTQDGSLADMERALIFPLNVSGDYIAFAALTVDQSNGSVAISGWTSDRARSVAFAYNVGLPASTDPPTEAQTEAQGAGATGGGLVTGFTSDFEMVLPAGTVVPGNVIKVLLVAYLNENGTGPDGTAQDHGTPVGVQGERVKITDPNGLGDGVVISRALREGVRTFLFSGEFSASDWNTVAWSTGSLFLQDGTIYAISSGNTGDMASDVIRYIYFDKAVSTTVLQVTTDPTVALGEDVVLLAVAWRAVASNQDASFVERNGFLGIGETEIGPNSIKTTHIQALAVVTAHLAAGSVTAAKISVAELSAITAIMGDVIAGRLMNDAIIDNPTAGIRIGDPGTYTIPGSWNVYIDLAATGSDPFIYSDDFRIYADGSAEFAGVITASVAVLQGGLQVDLDTLLLGAFEHQGSTFGVFGTTATTKRTVSGARNDPEQALADLLQSLEDYGLINDTTTVT